MFAAREIRLRLVHTRPGNAESVEACPQRPRYADTDANDGRRIGVLNDRTGVVIPAGLQRGISNARSGLCLSRKVESCYAGVDEPNSSITKHGENSDLRGEPRAGIGRARHLDRRAVDDRVNGSNAALEDLPILRRTGVARRDDGPIEQAILSVSE